MNPLPERGFPPHHNPEIHLDFKDTSIAELSELFNEYEAQTWINKWSVIDSDGFIDIDQTATRAGAVIEQSPARREGRQASLSVKKNRWKIEEHVSGSETQRTFLIGHELGHVAVFSHYLAQSTEAYRAFRVNLITHPELYIRTEHFCDYFSLRLIGYKDTLDSVDWDNIPRADGSLPPHPWRPRESDIPLFEMNERY